MRNPETSFAPVEIFCSFARADAPFLAQLELHLSMLQREGSISTWHKHQIIAGSNSQAEVDQHLNTASLILLLISSNFLASDYCYGTEMQRALQRYEAGEAVVIPLLLRPCDWQSAPFATLQMLPTEARPITKWRNRDEAWANVVTGIRNALKLLNGAEEEAPASTGQQPVKVKQKPGQPAPFPPIWNVPYRYTFFFTGRDRIVEHLFTSFTSERHSGTVPVHALSGLGGLGKTQTAVEYAYRYRQHYRTVLWMRAETEDNLFASFKSAAELLKRPAANVLDTQSLLLSMMEWFQNMTGWLLILDNADNLALIDSFIPRTARGHVLLTTRATALGQVAQSLPLTPLTADEGALCLLRRANYLSWTSRLSDASPTSVKAARDLARLMDGLPLALEQAGAYIETTGRSVSGYLDLYREYRPEIQRSQYGEFPNYHEPVAFAWNIAREMVQQQDPAAIELLHLCAFLAPEAIPYDLFTMGVHLLGPVLGPVAANPLALDRSISLLRSHSLIKNEVDRETDISRLIIHPVLQEILQDSMDEQSQLLLAQKAVDAVACTLPSVDWPIMQAHARRCLSWIEHWEINSPSAELIRQHFASEHL